jgi:hypothetical protein
MSQGHPSSPPGFDTIVSRRLSFLKGRSRTLYCFIEMLKERE